MAKKKKTGGRAIESVMTRRIAMALGMIACVGGLGAGSVYGSRYLESRAEAFVGDAEPTVRILWPALGGGGEGDRVTWLPAGERARLTEIARTALANGGSLGVDGVRSVSTELWSQGWFSERPTVRRTGGGVVVVEARWRVPAAAVRFDGRDQLIAWDGAALPLRYPRGQSGLRVILGASFGPGEGGVIDPSRAWPGEDVAAGLALLDLLRVEGLDDQVAAVDAGRVFKDGMLEIVTTRGGRIVWGSPVGRYAPGQKSDGERVDVLRALLGRTGMLDAGESRVEIYGPRVEIDRRGG